jgi:Ca2+-binding EF-hand superfamily protein
MRMSFKKYDKNRDGKLTRKEFYQEKARIYTALCVDVATMDQLCFKQGTDPKEKTLRDLFAILDANRDNFLV